MNPDHASGADERALGNRCASVRLLIMLPVVCIGALLAPVTNLTAATDADSEVAMQLANLLRSARTVISSNQDVINDPDIGDKGLTGEKVLADAIALYGQRTGEDLTTLDTSTPEGLLLRAQMDAILAVMEENQSTINAEGVGFKGFIPAVFARLVNETFAENVGDRAEVKVTAPENLVRNRKARPDAWETSVIEKEFLQPDWPEGQPFSEVSDVEGRQAFRILVPEYYTPSCLACHGEPAGEVDITGYPKEGGKEGDLGAAISITLFK
jgi:hypothetical protein